MTEVQHIVRARSGTSKAMLSAMQCDNGVTVTTEMFAAASRLYAGSAGKNWSNDLESLVWIARLYAVMREAEDPPRAAPEFVEADGDITVHPPMDADGKPVTEDRIDELLMGGPVSSGASHGGIVRPEDVVVTPPLTTTAEMLTPGSPSAVCPRCRFPIGNKHLQYDPKTCGISQCPYKEN